MSLERARVCVCAYVRVCVRVSVRACVRAGVCACGRVGVSACGRVCACDATHRLEALNAVAGGKMDLLRAAVRYASTTLLCHLGRGSVIEKPPPEPDHGTCSVFISIRHTEAMKKHEPGALQRMSVCVCGRERFEEKAIINRRRVEREPAEHERGG